jgi:hypothetical protein
MLGKIETLVEAADELEKIAGSITASQVEWTIASIVALGAPLSHC